MSKKKSVLFISILIMVSLHGISQQKSSDKDLLDSLKQFDKLIGDIDSHQSYFKLNLAISNELFSVRNRALNALQSDKKIVFTPSIGYYHKSGFSLALAGYLLSDSGKTNFYQYSVTPSYDYETGKTINAGVSFTRYITKNTNQQNASPIQNDLYAYLNFKKPWLRPGVALGFSGGSAKDVSLVTANLPVLGTKTFYDTATTSLKEFSLIGSLEHTFSFDALISSKDNLDITPGIMINTGSGKETVSHKNRYSAKVQNKRSKLKSQSSVTSFELQSVGLNFDINYTIGKFDFAPQLYLDYYLPATTDKRFTQVFSINMAYRF